MDEKRYAVLIDADNISSKYISSILDEMTKYGAITYKRIYGDWTSPQAGKWKTELMENSITPIQQFRNTVGKNATDSTLIIDAMDILYTHSVDGFCIVSSDGDFTRLASRLRESGMDVIGMGENKTPRSFRAACSVFTDLELLLEQEDDSSDIIVKEKPKKAHNIIRVSKIENAIIEIIQENDNKGKQTDLGEIGNRLQKKYSDFDVRNYGYSSLSTFINEMDGFKTNKVNDTVLVSLKEDDNIKEQEDTTPKGDGTSPKNFYSSIAKALKEEGIFPDLEDDSFSNIKDPEDFRDLIENQIKAGLDERQKRIDEALNVGVEPDEIKRYENTLQFLESTNDDALKDESQKGEDLRKNLIF